MTENKSTKEAIEQLIQMAKDLSLNSNDKIDSIMSDETKEKLIHNAFNNEENLRYREKIKEEMRLLDEYGIPPFRWMINPIRQNIDYNSYYRKPFFLDLSDGYK